MFQILGLWSSISYGIVKGIYGTVAKIYDLMINLTSTSDQYDFSSFTQSIYVIVGVFMLFRVAVSLIQMLINPDQINDKQVGAGKLIARIVTCIILLIVFSPNSFLMAHSTGWLDRGQDAIIGPDGFLENFMPEANLSSEKTIDVKDNNSNIYSMSFGSNLLYENVYAKSNWSKTCYFYNTMSVTGINTTYTAKNTKNFNKTYYKITFYSKDKKPSGATLVSKSAGIYAVSVGGKENGQKFADAKFSQQNNKLKSSAYIGNCANWGYLFAIGKIVYSPSSTKTVYTPGYASLLFRGANSFAGMKAAVDRDIKNNPDEYKYICEQNPDACSDVVKDSVSKINTWLPGIGPEAVAFATNTVSSFQDCTKESQKCSDAKEEQFGKGGADAPTAQQNIVQLMDDDALSLDFIFSIIAGIGLIIFLLILCVDVVVRKLKLLLLSMIAPLPIICYADPKDKIFMSWLKMFFAVYVDLFIKLFAIKIVLVLIQQLDTGAFEGIEKFFLIVGILVFAKLVPGMISKIFGLDSMGGSFKDIASMGKRALGVGAGAAIGAGAGLITGGAAFAATKGQGFKERLFAGAGALGSGASGLLRGAGSGSKGNILGGAKNVAGINAKRREQYTSGLKPTNLLAGATLGKIGMDYASRQDRGMVQDKDNIEEYKKMADVKGDMENIAEESKFMKTLRNQQATGETNYTESQMEGFRDRWIQSQISGDQGDMDQLQIDTHYGDDIIESGKKAGILEKLDYAQTLLSSNSTIRDAMNDGNDNYTAIGEDGKPHNITVSNIDSFESIKTASTISKKNQTDIRKKQAKITESDKYRTAAATRDDATKK